METTRSRTRGLLLTYGGDIVFNLVAFVLFSLAQHQYPCGLLLAGEPAGNCCVDGDEEDGDDENENEEGRVEEGGEQPEEEGGLGNYPTENNGTGNSGEAGGGGEENREDDGDDESEEGEGEGEGEEEEIAEDEESEDEEEETIQPPKKRKK